MMEKKIITAIVLTKNEEIHIARCLDNLTKIGALVKLIDSFSTDKTIDIAKKYPNVEVYQNSWVNYAVLFICGIENCNIDTPWVMRIDADEYVDNDFCDYIKKEIENLPNDVTGIFVKRGNYFLNRPVKFGESDTYHLKIWRKGKAFCENKWMDEHMITKEGRSVIARGVLIDHNLHSLSKFLEKHNSYATREAIDYFEKYESFDVRGGSEKSGVSPTHKVKNLYYRFPPFIRPIIYYFYIMILKAGVLGGLQNILYHTIQKLGYRFIVDLKIYEAKLHFRDDNSDPVEYLKKSL